MTKLEAAIKQVTNKAASGNQRAFKDCIDLLRHAEATPNPPAAEHTSMGDIDQEVINGILQRFQGQDQKTPSQESWEGLTMTMTPVEYQAFSRHDLRIFTHRAFCELNPRVSFFHNWHNQLIAGKLEACQRREITRLIINVPPRSLQSHAAAVAFPAFPLGHNTAY